MKPTLIIENNSAQASLHEQKLKDLGELLPPVKLSVVEEVERACKDPTFLPQFGRVLVDLELGPDEDTGPGDYLGRDRVLPLVRDCSPWIPVILVSRFVFGSGATLGKISPYGFDAVLPKSYFTTRGIGPREWNELKRIAALNRMASLTGRHVQGLQKLLDSHLELDYGVGIKSIVEEFGEQSVCDCCKLMDFGCEKLTFDTLLHGYSGLKVIKVTSHTKTRRAGWLFKFGSDPTKLTNELNAYRRVFRDGLTRRVSVPCMWWHPITWNAVSGIAYEFEEASKPFLNYVRDVGLQKAFDDLQASLAELYRGTGIERIIPRKHLRRILGPATKFGKGAKPTVVSALLEEREHEILDRGSDLRVGNQHGDLHARNILVGPNSPVFIDFAHYISRGECGLPFIDMVKLLVDLWCFCDVPITLREILDASIFERGEFKKLAETCFVSEKGELTATEKSVVGAVAQCYMRVYIEYPDVPADRRIQLEKALEGC
jgi:hypothetical protein